MSREQIYRAVQLLCGRMRQRWERLTEEDLDVIAQRPDRLLDAIERRYGIARRDAEREIREWVSRAAEF